MEVLGRGTYVCMLRNGVSVLKFAENACGVVQVVLNGSISNAFDRKRYLFLCILFVRVSTVPMGQFIFRRIRFSC